MKKFSITQLETARKNPLSFAQMLSGGGGIGNYRTSKYTDWKNAIYEFHKTEDLSKSLDYFESFFYKHFKKDKRNIKSYEIYVKAIENYASEHKKNEFIFVESRKSVEIELIKEKLKITGQVPIINLNNKLGYSVYFFAKQSTDWEDELRFPIIQDCVAKEVLGVDSDEVEIGIFALDTGNHLQKSFSHSAIKKARKELESIGNIIVDNLGSS